MMSTYTKRQINIINYICSLNDKNFISRKQTCREIESQFKQLQLKPTHTIDAINQKILSLFGKKSTRYLVSLNDKVTSPPLGLKPKQFYEKDIKDKRFSEVCNVIASHYEAGLKINLEWVAEYNELIDWFNENNYKIQ